MNSARHDDFLKAKFPTQHGDFKQVIAEGDLVFLHVMDIFRIAHVKVVEHWDVIRDIP